MTRVLGSFKVRSGKRILDYRLGENLDLGKIRDYFQESYRVKKLWQGARHVLGLLTKDNQTYFLKLSISEGISVVTRNEYYWNNYFNNYSLDTRYSVPKNYDNGLYENKYFYLITDYFSGKLLCETRSVYNKITDLVGYLPHVIELSEFIQQLPQVDFTADKYEEVNYQVRFLSKTRSWFGDIPISISKEFNVKILLEIIEKGVSELSSRPRHGDFTPWHIVKLADKRLGLIDGEHALPDGVEGYDICYFIQRVFSVLKNPNIAGDIYWRLKEKGYQTNKLKIVLAARAVGGFLDESLNDKPDYGFANSFKDWVMKLT